MPPKQKKQRKPDGTFTKIAIRIERHEAKVAAAVNFNVYEPQSAFQLEDEDPLYKYTVQVILNGVATYPPERAGNVFELTIFGDDSRSWHHDLKLKDVQEREELYNTPKYREYRGKQVPIYIAPHGLVHIQKERGARRWSAWLFTPTHLASNLMILLGQNRSIFLSLREYKEGRDCWIRDFSLQTMDPKDE